MHRFKNLLIAFAGLVSLVRERFAGRGWQAKGFTSCLAVAILALVSGNAHAATHWAIIADFMQSRNDPAYFDVASASGTQVTYTVYQATGNRSKTVPFTDGFATSPDLFNLGGSAVALPALVEATTVDFAGSPDGVPSLGLLRQKKLILSCPSNQRGASGTLFNVPLGNLGNAAGGGSGAHLLIANPNGGRVTGGYVVGGTQTNFIVESGAVKDVVLNAAPQLVIVSTLDGAIVQLAIVGKGQEFAMTIVSPLF